MHASALPARAGRSGDEVAGHAARFLHQKQAADHVPGVAVSGQAAVRPPVREVAPHKRGRAHLPMVGPARRVAPPTLERYAKERESASASATS